MELKRLFDLPYYQLEKFPRADALAGKVNKEWIKFSTQEYVDNAKYFALGLVSIGISNGDKIATISNNRPEWNFVDMGILQAGAVHVPIYPTLSNEDTAYIIEHSEAKILILSDKLLYTRIKPLADNIKQIAAVYTFNEVEGSKNWNEIIELGKKADESTKQKLEEQKSKVDVHDLASIIYTSGTTGVSKGVMLTHENIVANILGGRNALPLNNNHKVLSFLPLCHIYERTIGYLFQFSGCGIYYAQNMGTIVQDIQEIKPDGFDTVPRLLEKVYDGIMKKGAVLSGVKKKLFDWAVDLGLKYEFDGANGALYEMQLKLANKLIFSKWREALGGNIKFIGSGGAALQPRLARIFWAAQIPVQEGYGLTETSPLIAFNYPNRPDIEFGTVGPVLDGVTVKIAEDGEILVKGHNVMKGYYKNDDLTKEVIDNEGWFHTGDIGMFVKGKYLKITDRKKEIFKLSSGKYIAPQVIENKMKESIYIEQLMVVGEGEKTASAIISPDFETLQAWAKKSSLNFTDKADLISKPEVKKMIQAEIMKLNKDLGKTEQIAQFRIVPDSWSPESGEMSQTLKLKRRILNEKYQKLVNEMKE
jgi:long-chain acyl-CoA synthetase